ncbi:MAG: ribosome-binding factor A [bacterium]
MKNERIEKIRSLLHKEVGVYLHSDLNLSDVQITRVLISPDLKKVKFMFVSVSENFKQGFEVEEFLNRNSRKIRKDLFRRLSLKRVPEFMFEYDRGYYL